MENPKVLYSETSSVVVGTVPESPYLIKNLRIFYHTSNSLKLEWNNSMQDVPYSIYRASSSNPSNFVHIGTTTSKYFIDSNLSTNYTYKYEVRFEFDVEGSYISDRVVSHASQRSNTQRVQLKECKFLNKTALNDVECWLFGTPEMRACYAIYNEKNPNQPVKNRTIEFEPDKRKNIYEQYWPVNEDFLDRDEVNKKGSIVNFFWYEHDGGCKNRSSGGISSCEVHYNENYFPNNVRYTPNQELTKMSILDDLISWGSVGTSLLTRFNWWDSENTLYSEYYKPRNVDGLYWRVETK